MFGVFRCNKDVQNNMEFVELSEDSSVDARNHTMLACDQCRKRKLKCSGDDYQCSRCQITSTTCTYRSAGRSAGQSSNSKRRQSASELNASLKRRPSASELNASARPPAKRQQSRSNADCRPALDEVTNMQFDMNQPFSSADPKDGFWTPISLLGLDLNERLCEWDDLHSKELQGVDLNLQKGTNVFPLEFPLPEIRNIPSFQESTAVSNMIDQSLNQPLRNPPVTTSSVDASEDRNRDCRCIESLANILEKISGDGGSDMDEGGRFDHLLLHLYEGVATCKQVLPCSRCSVSTTNSMFVVTIIQQLAAISQALSLQLLRYKQEDSTISATDESPSLLCADIYVGRYKVPATPLHLKFLFPIVSMHLKDLQQLLEHLQEDIKKGTKTFKLLSAAADVVQRASNGLQLDQREESS